MKMVFDLLVFFGLLLCVASRVNSREIEKCPTDPVKWKERSDVMDCPQGESYHCVRRRGENLFVETCFQEVSFVKGSYPVLDKSGQRDAVTCPKERFQNTTYRSNQPGLDLCPFKKTKCDRVGQVTNLVDSSDEDNTCSCKEGFAFTVLPNGVYFCRPGLENCRCYKNSTRDDNSTRDTRGDDSTRDTRGDDSTRDTRGDDSTRDTRGDDSTRDTRGDDSTRDTRGDDITRDTRGDDSTRDTRGDDSTRDTRGDDSTRDTRGDDSTRDTRGDDSTRDTRGDDSTRDTRGDDITRDTRGDDSTRDTRGDDSTRDTRGDDSTRDDQHYSESRTLLPVVIAVLCLVVVVLGICVVYWRRRKIKPWLTERLNRTEKKDTSAKYTAQDEGVKFIDEDVELKDEDVELKDDEDVELKDDDDVELKDEDVELKDDEDVELKDEDVELKDEDVQGMKNCTSKQPTSGIPDSSAEPLLQTGTESGLMDLDLLPTLSKTGESFTIYVSEKMDN